MLIFVKFIKQLSKNVVCNFRQILNGVHLKDARLLEIGPRESHFVGYDSLGQSQMCGFVLCQFLGS